MIPAFADLQTADSLAHTAEMPAFYEAVADGSLAQYTLIQPRSESDGGRRGQPRESPGVSTVVGHASLPPPPLRPPVAVATSKTGPSNWQHPDNSIAAGEALLASV